MANRVGQQFGNYRLTRFIDDGGFAEVYLGEHIYLGTEAAIKIMTTHFNSNELELFRNEARTIARLKHPHIIRILEFGIEEKTPFLVMDYAPGGTLSKRYAKGPRPTPKTLVPYIQQVASALQHAHYQKLVHRDVKPENILFESDNHILLSDFGIAIAAHSTRSMNTQNSAGTIYYMAPEQLQGKPRPASDQYSLAVVIYEMLCGSRPFTGTSWEVAAQHLTALPTSMKEKGVSIQTEVEAVIMKALAKDPHQRYGSITEFAKAFEEVCREKVAPPPLIYCQRCGTLAPQGAIFCARCGVSLAPAQPLMVSPPAQQKRSIPDQPTLVPLNDNVQRVHRQQLPANLPCPVCNALVAPTMDMCLTCGTPLQFNGVQMLRRSVDNYERAKQASLAYQQGVGQRLGFVAGTRTDRGIKRKHKPNEDSLFAVQGVRGVQGRENTKQPFGLFVVADGMSEHANGQDASRLAIQSIVDYMLPSLLSHPEMTGEDLRPLLIEGVQYANQVVHQNNMEQRADMGTTMTAALIVDTIAYVANVGDSRTYLYREPYGLVKMTQDHSAVASLVDAGIIKPDDIYTHPKLNEIYRSLGEKPVVEVDSFMQELKPKDKLLLCSDGLWKMVRDPNIAEVLKQQNPDPGVTGDGLIQAALAGGGEENVSVIVVQIIAPGGEHQGLQPGVQLLAKPDSLNMPSLPILR